MFEVSVKTQISAAHRLVGYNGLCASVHGHNWEVEIYVRGSALNELGLLVDFRDIKEALKTVIGDLDHCDLNSLPAFAIENPSSENLARYLFNTLSASFNTDRYWIARVRVAETPGTSASYWKDEHR
jgi:6-pyruvoyltetrahydropterin/6-carboxytetrahydropterin synthase